MRTRPALMMGLFATAVVALWWTATSRPLRERDSDIQRIPAPSADDVSLPTARVQRETTLEPASQKPVTPRAAPAEQEPPASTRVPEADQPTPVDSNLPQRQGPVEDLARRFAGESRSDDSQNTEASARKAFTDETIPTDMLRTIECRRSVCRGELRWSQQFNNGYVLGLTRAVGSYSAALGIEAPGDPDADGRRSVVVYWSLVQ